LRNFLTRRGLVIVAGIILIALAGIAYNRLIVSRRVVRPLQYVCPLQNTNARVEKADCTDCMLYPVDKSHALPATYAPILVETGLDGGGRVSIVARDPLVRLFTEAKRRGLSPTVTSAYRSYAEQFQVFRGWMWQEWRERGNFFTAFLEAQRYSAYAGHSEHQLGTAIDVNCRGCTPFDTDDQRNIKLWTFLEQNAHLYGFIISYPRDIEARTGYQYEPWHIRYIGVEDATALFEEGYTTGNGSCAASLLRLKTTKK